MSLAAVAQPGPQKRAASPGACRAAAKRPSPAPESGLAFRSGGSSGSGGDGGLVLRPPHAPERFAELGASLRAGRLVAFPTETVYGLGANGLEAAAVLKIFEAKGRPLNDPCILHVPGPEAALELLDLDDLERAVFGHLAGACWPGPLSIVARARPVVPREVTAQTDFVAVRAPCHPVALELLRAAGVPVAAPSANRFGHISPTTPEHVAEDLGHVEGLKILDGGPCGVGIESTVVKLDLARRRIVVLRKGGTTGERLERVLAEGSGVFGAEVRLEFHSKHGDKAERPEASPPAMTAEGAAPRAEDDEAQQAPGMMLRHYAPALPTFLLSVGARVTGEARASTSAAPGEISQAVLVDFGGRLQEHARHFLRSFDLCVAAGPEGRSEAEEACRAVFATLRAAEAFAQSSGAQLICIADFEAQGGYAEALHDRLFRAASGRRLLLAPGVAPALVAAP